MGYEVDNYMKIIAHHANYYPSNHACSKQLRRYNCVT